ncbi:TOMM precursor leader peptide-binding protein [Streptomyces sp. NPDC057217]|uniref:TOMM precursor leader peptide-binding protein n=1 Tax=Streptomyces sp. NPDC057217 TaxID=3346054 RepID=UPI003631B419
MDERTGRAGLAFKPHLKPEVVPGEGVYLVSERGVTALRGPGVTALAPLLDGTRSRDRLVADAGRTIPAQQAERLVSGLLTAGLLDDRDPSAAGPAAERAFWELAGMDGVAATRRTAGTPVEVVGVGEASRASVAELSDALAASGVRLHRPGTPGAATATGTAAAPGLALVVCDDYTDPALGAVDAAHRASGVPWLLVRFVGEQPWIGPVFRPGEGPCWTCVTDALRRNRPAETYLDRALGRRAFTPPSSLAAGRAAGLHLAALEAVKWLAGHRHPGQDAIWRLDTLTLAGRHHPVRRRPQCPACGDPGIVARRAAAPPVLRSRPKAAVDCGDRWLPPEEMLRRYGHLVDPLTGVVKEVRRDSRGPEFLNCFHAGHNPVHAPDGLSSVRAGLRSTSSGKGTTALHARVSALCEAVERHSGFFQGDEPTLRASYREVADRAVHPDAVQLFHPRQFEDREAWNAAHGPAHRICEPVDDSVPLDWTPVWSLTGGGQRLLPTSMLYYNAPRTPGSRFASANSNGSAAGSCVEDAIVQGFLELVERDAVGLWWYNRTRQPAVDLGAFDEPWIREVREGHAGLHRELWALDLTSDLGVPVFAALSRRTDKPGEDITLGFGAHFDPRLALRRALAEVNQMLPPVARVRADGTGYSCDDPAALSWWQGATVADQPYLLPDPALPVAVPGSRAPVRRGDLREDVAAIGELVAAHGMELLVLDQTRPDVGLPVVKVVVPGLRTFWTRFGPGRLYDVPVRLGRLSAPTRYEDLNPVPLFL